MTPDRESKQRPRDAATQDRLDRKVTADEIAAAEEPPPDVAQDKVTAASWESFPASDPPAWVWNEAAEPDRSQEGGAGGP